MEMEQKVKEKVWNLGIDFRTRAELEDFLKWWGHRVVFGVKNILVSKGVLGKTDNNVIFGGGSGSQLTLQDLEKEIKRKYPNAKTKLVQANN
jgi:hypothetical protein